VKISDRDRKTIIVGGIAAVVIVSVFYVILPLKRGWSETGDDLAPKLEQVAQLRDRVEGRDSLLARRNVLVSRLGSLLGPDPSTETEKPDKPARDSSEPKKDKEEEAADKPSQNEEETNGNPPEGDASPPEPATDTETAESEDKAENGDRKGKAGETEEADQTDQTDRTDQAEKAEKPDEAWSGVRLAAQLERLASKSGVKIKRVSPKKAPGSKQGRKHFTQVMMQVTFECNIDTLIKMLHALEKGDRFIRVERLQLTRNLSKGDTIDASLDVLAYEAEAGQP